MRDRREWPDRREWLSFGLVAVASLLLLPRYIAVCVIFSRNDSLGVATPLVCAVAIATWMLATGLLITVAILWHDDHEPPMTRPDPQV